jgi:hypothetical protein
LQIWGIDAGSFIKIVFEQHFCASITGLEINLIFERGCVLD